MGTLAASTLALGTANDWTGRTTDFVGMGVVVTVLAVAGAAFVLVHARWGTEPGVFAGVGAGMTTLAAAQVFAWQPSVWWIIGLTAFGAVARWDLRRAMRRRG